jgi:uncharacterized protein (TIGR02466 family)
MNSRVRALFPTLLYVAPLQRGGRSDLNRRLLAECLQLREDDLAGRRWSTRNYPGGYTSYGSLCRMQQLSPTFARLERALTTHVRRYAKSLALDLEGRDLSMTDCWVNVMPEGVVHSLHLHPLSTISGTYYVRTPSGASGLKFEDPRLDRYMAAPPRRADAPEALRPWHTVTAKAGQVVLFESWLRHEVPPNPSKTPRVSISFNFSWF